MLNVDDAPSVVDACREVIAVTRSVEFVDSVAIPKRARMVVADIVASELRLTAPVAIPMDVDVTDRAVEAINATPPVRIIVTFVPNVDVAASAVAVN